MLGFVGRMFGNSRDGGRHGDGKRGRGRGKTVRELKERRRLAFLSELEEKDPGTYRQMMLRECGLLQDDGKIDMAIVMKVIDYLKQIGLKVVPSKGGTDLDDDSLRSWIRDLAPMFAPVLAGAMRGQQQTAESAQTAGAREPTYRVVQPDPPAALPQQSQPTPRQEAPAASLVSRFIISQLDGKSPKDAAAWLLGQPQAGPLVDRLKDTPDTQLLALFDSLAQQAPDYAGFVAWLKARPEWTIETVHEIRAQSASPTGSPPPPVNSMGI